MFGSQIHFLLVDKKSPILCLKRAYYQWKDGRTEEQVQRKSDEWDKREVVTGSKGRAVPKMWFPADTWARINKLAFFHHAITVKEYIFKCHVMSL